MVERKVQFFGVEDFAQMTKQELVDALETHIMCGGKAYRIWDEELQQWTPIYLNQYHLIWELRKFPS